MGSQRATNTLTFKITYLTHLAQCQTGSWTCCQLLGSYIPILETTLPYELSDGGNLWLPSVGSHFPLPPPKMILNVTCILLKTKQNKTAILVVFTFWDKSKFSRRPLRLEQEQFRLRHWGVLQWSSQKRKTFDCLGWVLKLGCPVVSLPQDLHSAGNLECSHRHQGGLLPEICNLVWTT